VAAWNFEQFVKHIDNISGDNASKGGELHPFYLFYGDEVFLAEDALKKIKAKVFEDSLADFNLDNFYGGELDIDNLGAALETLPMMGQKRLVILKDAHLLKAAELEKIAEYVSIPIDTTVFVAVFENVDQRKKYLKTFLRK
jgi:DNA polymerase-3 subunit delta